MTPRELVVSFLGFIVGVLFAEYNSSPCRRACCVTQSRRERWIAGEDPERQTVKSDIHDPNTCELCAASQRIFRLEK